MDSETKPNSNARGYESITKMGSKVWLTEDLRKKHLIGVPISARLLDALEEFRMTIGEDVSRPEVIRTIVSDFLRQKRFLKDRVVRESQTES